MSKNYDNWERLVSAVLRRERDKQLALNPSRDPSSIGSLSSPTSSSSSELDLDLDHDQHSLVHRHVRSEIPMDYSDLTLSHDEWKAMLPPGKHEIVFRSASLMFFLDQRTQKNCFLLGAEKLEFSRAISCKDPSNYWELKSHPKSRFSMAAKLLDSPGRMFFREICIQAQIDAKMLTPETSYAAYLVFGLPNNYTDLGFTISRIGFSNHDLIPEGQTRIVQFQLGNSRVDGWTEIAMGNFYVRHDRNTEIHVSLQKTSMKGGLIVEGVEFRPSRG